MKIKILESSGWYRNFVGSEFEIDEYDIDENRLRFKVNNQGWIYESDCVITELPKSFCVKRCDDRDKWKKYIKWLNKTYNKEYFDNVGTYYGCNMGRGWSLTSPIGTEIHIDDILKRIDYMESQLTVNMKIGKFNIGDTVKVIKPGMTYEHYDVKFKQLGFKNTEENIQFSSNTYAEVFGVINHDNPHHTEPLVAIRDDSTGDECLIAESGIEIVPLSLKEYEAEFDLTTDEGRLAYAKKYYPIGTRVTNTIGERVTVEEIFFCDVHHIRLQIGGGLIYDGDNGKWAEIIKEETNMQKQKLSRKGLKEIHSVACGYWQATLALFGTRNPFEDYVELTQKEVDEMFNACTEEQLPIVSKYLKKDGSVDLSEDWFVTDYITRRVGGEYEDKAFVLAGKFNWEIKTDSFGYICLIPTKKKFSAEKGWVL